MPASTTGRPGPTVRRWIEEHAHPVTTTDVDDDLRDLESLREMVGDARVVGVGETTRAAHEVVALGHRVLRLLVEEMGFRALVLHDDAAIVDGLDHYVRTGQGDPEELLDGLWMPWRTQEMLGVVSWARAFVRANPADPLRLIGLDPPAARPEDYAAVIDLAAQAGAATDELRRHYDVIVTAHELGEHIQHARGIHPGRRFVEHARDARDLVAACPDSTARTAALDKASRIVDFHATSMAEGYDYDTVRERTVATVTELAAQGTKVVYWEGFAFTAKAARFEPALLLEPFQSVGNGLHQHLGAGYFSLLIGFAGGDISGLHDGQHAPPPMPDSVDADLTTAGLERYLLDLRSSRTPQVARWLRGPHRLRIIGGVYDADADAEHYVTTQDLDEWFDAVLQAGVVTPTRPSRSPPVF